MIRRCLLITLTTLLATANGLAQDAVDGVRLRENVVYGAASGVELTLHLAQPENAESKRAPGLLFFHRGGWVSGSKDRYLDVIQQFAARGYVAASVGYRFAPDHPFPAQVEDAKCAVRWMRAHAQQLGVDPERIGAIGESAGAHLSMMLGALDPDDGLEGDGGWPDQSSKVQAVVSFYGPVDLRWDVIESSPYLERLRTDVAKRLLTAFVGGDPALKREQLHRASPIKYVDRGDAPMLLLQGTSDALVLPDQAMMMTQALTDAGVEGRTELIFGKVHDWDGEDFHKPLLRARRFFDDIFGVVADGNADTGNDRTATVTTAETWNRQLAAQALDGRAAEWNSWSRSQRSQDTTCISCHTGIPYLVARGALGRSLGSSETAETMQELLADIQKRVQHRDEVTPWYSFDEDKSLQSIGTEAVISALALSVRDAESSSRSLDPTTREAFDWMWSTQLTDGQQGGSFPWLDFELQPWESMAGTYWGATLAAIAVGIAPENYASTPDVQPHVDRLRDYLKQNLESQSLHNRASLLLASTRLEGLLTDQQRRQIAAEMVSAQRRDGGWSLSDLGEWPHQTSRSDAYATGLMTYTLAALGVSELRDHVSAGREWLIANQDPERGGWWATSVNRRRPDDTFIGKFMQDAASAYAVMALLATEP